MIQIIQHKGIRISEGREWRKFTRTIREKQSEKTHIATTFLKRKS